MEITDVEFDIVAVDNQVSAIVKFGVQLVGSNKIDLPVAVGGFVRSHQMSADVGLESFHFQIGFLDALE